MDVAERDRLVELARAQGATEEEIAQALAIGEIGPLALERALFPRRDLVSFDDAVERSGADHENVARFFRSLGFPDPAVNAPELSPAEVALVGIADGALALLGPEATDQIARVVGNATYKMAETVIDAFRLRAEVPQQDAGVAYSEIAAGYVAVAKEMLPPLAEGIGALFQRHMLNVIYSNWAVDEGGGAITTSCAIGFVDLVGYTAASRAASVGALAAMVDQFEDRVTEVVVGHGGRLVKMIGDEAMFVAPDAGAVCRMASDLVAQFGDGVRVGAAAGSVVSLRGDYYGEIVNVASRLTSVADPGTALVSAAVESGADGFDFEALGGLTLKGFDDAVPAFRLR